MLSEKQKKDFRKRIKAVEDSKLYSTDYLDELHRKHNGILGQPDSKEQVDRLATFQKYLMGLESKMK